MTDHSAPCEVPPGLFFKAKDLGAPRHVDNGQSVTDVASSRRASQYGRCLSRVEALLKDLRSLKSFDEMGNIEMAAEQVSDRLSDTEAIIGELLDDIYKAAARYGHEHGRAEFDPDDAWGGPAGRAERLRLARTAPTPAETFGGGRFA